MPLSAPNVLTGGIVTADLTPEYIIPGGTGAAILLTWDADGDTPATASLGGNAMTPLGTTGVSPINFPVKAWALNNPPTGAQEVTFGTAPTYRGVSAMIVYPENIDLASLVTAVLNDADFGDITAMTLAKSTGDHVIMGASLLDIGGGATPAIAGTSGVVQVDSVAVDTLGQALLGYYTGVATSVNIGANAAGSTEQYHCQFAVVIREAAPSGVNVSLPAISAGSTIPTMSKEVRALLASILATASVQTVRTGVRTALEAITAGATVQPVSVEVRALLASIAAGATVQPIGVTLGGGVVVSLPAIQAGADVGGSLGFLHELDAIVAQATVQGLSVALVGPVLVAIPPLAVGATVQPMTVALVGDVLVAIPPIAAGASVQPVGASLSGNVVVPLSPIQVGAVIQSLSREARAALGPITAGATIAFLGARTEASGSDSSASRRARLFF